MEINMEDLLSQSVCPQCGEFLTLDLESGQFRCKSCGYIKAAHTYSAPAGSVATAAISGGEYQLATIEGSLKTIKVTLPTVPKHTHEEFSKIENELAEIKKSISVESEEIQLQEKICTWLDKTMGLRSKFAGQYVAITYDAEVHISKYDIDIVRLVWHC